MMKFSIEEILKKNVSSKVRTFSIEDILKKDDKFRGNTDSGSKYCCVSKFLSIFVFSVFFLGKSH